MDVPTELKDWWIYLIPGDLLIIEALFTYDTITRFIPDWFGPKFEILNILSYNEKQIALFLLLIVSVGLVIGSILEGLSYRFFGRFHNSSSLILSAFRDVKGNREDLMKQLLADPKLFPEELWKGSFEELEKNIKGVGDFVETELLREANESESESLNETAVAISFTQSFFLSFIFFPTIICWSIVREFFGIAILLSLIYAVCLIYLWKDQMKLTQIYWVKTFGMFVSHLWKMKSEPAKPNTTKK